MAVAFTASCHKYWKGSRCVTQYCAAISVRFPDVHLRNPYFIETPPWVTSLLLYSLHSLPAVYLLYYLPWPMSLRNLFLRYPTYCKKLAWHAMISAGIATKCVNFWPPTTPNLFAFFLQNPQMHNRVLLQSSKSLAHVHIQAPIRVKTRLLLLKLLPLQLPSNQSPSSTLCYSVIWTAWK